MTRTITTRTARIAAAAILALTAVITVLIVTGHGNIAGEAAARSLLQLLAGI